MIKKRLERIEKKLLDKGNGLRVFVNLSVYYGEFNPETDIYWTDEPMLGGLDEFYKGTLPRRVKNPSGLVPKSGEFVGIW